MGKKIMNTVLFLVVLGGCVAMTLLTGNGSSGTMIYNFAFLAVMAVIYLAGLFGGMFRVDSIGEALARGTQELSSIFKIPGKAKSEDLSCLKGMFEQKYLDEAEKTEQQIAELEERLRTIRAAQKKEEDSEIIRAIRSTKMGGRELLALLDNIQAGNVTFLTAVNNASEEAETEEAIEKDA